MKRDRMMRVNRVLREALAEILPRVADPRVKAADVVGVAAVHTTSDLQHAKVFVIVSGEDDRRRAVMAGLARARGFVRTELGRRVALKRTPELHFELDTTASSAAAIEAVLGELAQERARSGGGEGGKKMELIALEPAAALLAGARRVLITSHPNPDGDALGSALGAYWALARLGKEAVVYNPDAVPLTFRFLPGADGVVSTLPDEGFDLTLVLDCSDDRMFPHGRPGADYLGRVLVVDHHKTLGDIGDVVYQDVEAASVGVLLFRLFRRLDLTIDARIAESLYCSVLSDTGSFRYQNTNPEALRVAAELVAAGVDPWRVASNLYETRPPQQLKLLTKVLQTLTLSADGSAAALTVTEAMLAETGCTADMVDGFVNYARGLRGVEVAILLRPTRDRVRVSMRSRGAVDVSQIAQGFGGGGHRNAAGCTVIGEDVDALAAELFSAVSARLADARPGDASAG